MGESVAVLDYGSRWIKAGWAFNFPTDDEPRIMTPSAVTVEQAGGSGDAAAELCRPIRGGKIESWDQFESLAYYVLYELLGWEHGSEGNVMVCEPLLTSRPDRETMAQMMFEVFNATGFFVQDQAVLALYAVGRTSGLVIDIGHDKVDVGTVAEGLLNTSSVRRLQYGGQHLTQLLQRMLADPQRHSSQPRASAGGASDGGAASPAPLPAHTLSEAAAEALKELCARCADADTDPSTSAPSASASTSSSSAAVADETFRLPDGQEITVTAAERLRLGNALFAPGPLLGIPSPSPAEAACDSAACVIDPLTRKAMYENLLVVGGGSAIPGVPARLLAAMRGMLPATVAPALVPVPEYMPAPSVPRDASWVGGAVLAKVAMIQGHFIMKADYDEAGPVAVHRRCG